MSRNIHFDAIDIETNPETGLVGFANGGHYFWMMPKGTSDGFSTKKHEIWLERDEQCYGGYTGDRPWPVLLSRNRFEILTSAQTQLDCDRIVVRFETDDDTYRRLAEQLERLFVEHPGDLQLREFWEQPELPINDMPVIWNGEIATGFAAFFRTDGKLSIGELRDTLKLNDYLPSPTRAHYKWFPYMTIADDGRWLHLCDDNGYHLFHDQQTMPLIRSLAQAYDTLVLVFPDSDESYDLEHWVGGNLKRRCVYIDDREQTNNFVHDIGDLLHGEAVLRANTDPNRSCKMLWQVAAALDIEVNYHNLDYDLFIKH